MSTFRLRRPRLATALLACAVAVALAFADDPEPAVDAGHAAEVVAGAGAAQDVEQAPVRAAGEAERAGDVPHPRSGLPSSGCHWFGGYPTNPFAAIWARRQGRDH